MKIRVPKLTCNRCGHTWIPRNPVIKMCPKCKSQYWQRGKEMTQDEKYEAVCGMSSIQPHTLNEYPTLSAFKKALRENRVSGDYHRTLVIVSLDPNQNYTFVNDKPFECAICGWRGKGTGRNGRLVEGDRCPDCGAYL